MCTYPLYALHASTSMQRHREDTGTTIANIITTNDAPQTTKSHNHAELKNIILDEPTFHVRVYADADFQNIRTKHSQISFVIYLEEQHENANIIHWHRYRALCRPHSTEKAELMALDVALRSTDNI